MRLIWPWQRRENWFEPWSGEIAFFHWEENFIDWVFWSENWEG